ncbi:MAG: hypothetical protein IJD04_00825 [Desulfovibrionaceae bacterium]|nr:hypothetical protein [Desulfovibrionaceae bacterium]
MRNIIFSSVLTLAALTLYMSPAQAQTANPLDGQYRPYPGGDISYYNPGQVYPPPPGVSVSALPPSAGVTANTVHAAGSVQAQAVSGASDCYDPASGRFCPGVSIGALNPHTNYMGDLEWKLFAQRTASFGPVAVSPAAPAPAPVAAASQAKPKPKPKPAAAAKSKSKPKPKPAPQAAPEPPKREMSETELEQFCLEYVELCKDYFK